MPGRLAHEPSAARVAVIGLLGLAAAMGIGRFAFTPLLPLMQAREGLTLTQGGWLASANYLGYLVGAVACAARAPQPARAARHGLIGVAVFTLAMVWVADFAGRSLMRFGAGVSSALVLVGISSWALPLLADLRRARWSGWVFAGVGAGITTAGLIGLLAALWDADPVWAWLALGAIAAVVAALAQRDLRAPAAAPDRVDIAAAATRLSRADWLLVLCYGAFGFGYIIPATFLPAFARALIDNPLAFGSVWPVFGLAAAASTVFAARWLAAWSARSVWAVSQVVMAFGVLLQALWPSLPTTMVCALCVGGTLVVATMAGIELARQTAAQRAPRLIATMTAAFALGQLIGPLLVRGHSATTVAVWPGALAALLLIASSIALLARQRA
ncbi:MAG TPA: YbfB/YjiJ family MFS transporter [Burkholderiaceae bacterium]|nr:YbfB/YjiJ family MFS transporter [Burkholderiaceae bacterium]